MIISQFEPNRALVDININSATYPSRQIFHDGSKPGGIILRRTFVSFPNMAELQNAEEMFAIICNAFSNMVDGSHMFKCQMIRNNAGYYSYQQQHKAFEKFNGYVWVFGLSLKGKRGADNSLSQKTYMAAGTRKYTFLSYGVRYLKNVTTQQL